MNGIIFGRSRKSGQDSGEAISSRAVTLPGPVRAGLGLGRGEQALAGARDDDTGDWVVLTTWHFIVAAPDGQVQLRQPWHLVDAGAWGDETYTLTVTWVDGQRPASWTFRTGTGPGMLPQAFRERVQASVVLIKKVQAGRGQHARVIIRKELRTRELGEQVLLGASADAGNPELLAEIARARTEVRDQVGLPPPGPGE